ncbi:hypothetical protein EVAR_90225_1 [Eumeta japonica]|uniref:Uncharacterized protein n=1 Tax=Eumeta variegata TaxID=151549 RepID=A0A4C1YSG1_EUMVA|nr:hypothetical protein EVAR_90225_1 [Eumeta japonica]
MAFSLQLKSPTFCLRAHFEPLGPHDYCSSIPPMSVFVNHKQLGAYGEPVERGFAEASCEVLNALSAEHRFNSSKTPIF